jgi:hypothetical protein
MARKPYSPVASYEQLSEVEKKLSQATSVDDVRKLVVSDGPKVGYKAFCYILGGRMTAAAMKPDEACAAAAGLEQAGQIEAALTIYKAVLAVHKEHPIASTRAQALE